MDGSSRLVQTTSHRDSRLKKVASWFGTGLSDKDHDKYIHDYQSALGIQSERTTDRSLEDICRAIEIAESAVYATAQDKYIQATWLNNLGIVLRMKFLRTGEMEDINRSVEAADMAVTATSGNQSDGSIWLKKLRSWMDKPTIESPVMFLGNLSKSLSIRFEWNGPYGSIEDINRAIDITSRAVDATPESHPDRAGLLETFSVMLGTRYLRTGSIEDINCTIDHATSAVNATPKDHPDRAGRIQILSTALGNRYNRTRVMEDVNTAIEFAEITIRDTGSPHRLRSVFLSNLSRLLGKRFIHTGLIEDINRAIDLADMAVETAPKDYHDPAHLFETLSSVLLMRFEGNGSTEDLSRAVEMANRAVAETPQHNYMRLKRLGTFGRALEMRFNWSGSVEDIQRAIKIANMVNDSTPEGNPAKPIIMYDLSRAFFSWFRRTQSMGHIKLAIEAAQGALDAIPADHLSETSILYMLSIQLGSQSDLSQKKEDIDRAIEIAERIFYGNNKNYLKGPLSHNLSNMLGRRFVLTGSMDDISRAIELGQIAVDATPDNHPIRATRLNVLGTFFDMQFTWTGLDSMKRQSEEAGDIPKFYLDGPRRLKTFNNLFILRDGQKKSMNNLDRALSCYQKGWACQNAAPSIRITSAQHAADILAFQLRWDEASNILKLAVELLPLTSPRLLANDDKQYILARFSGLASIAAAVYLQTGGNYHQALELLEQGRCIITGLLLDMRTDLSDLQQQHPNLVREFESLRDKLDSSASKVSILDDAESIWKVQANEQSRVDKDLSTLITKIRSQPGFEDFLLPPTKEQLMAAADQGPIVVINVSSYRCDAFLIECRQIRVLPLPSLKEYELEKKIEQEVVASVSTLKWLWDTVTGPILDALGFQGPYSDNNWPHVWWIPTGALSHFPIHAAGYHSKESTKTVLDRVMSSYASSVKSLIHGRRCSIKELGGSDPEHALLVAMEKTPCYPSTMNLPFATKEVDILARLCPSLQLNPIIPPRRKKEVLSHLKICRIFHFAGHGHSDALDPSKSYITLEDWQENPLTVGDLRDFNISKEAPFLGYLSACSTSANKVNKLVDEVIHLSSAFQLAGFRHVIGTLWKVYDSHCVEVAKIVYETIRDEGMTDTAICRGLHQAIIQLRDGRKVAITKARPAKLIVKNKDKEICGDAGDSTVRSPHEWASYVHFGV